MSSIDNTNSISGWVEIFIKLAISKVSWWELNIINNLGLTIDTQGSLNIHSKLWLYVMLYLPFLE